MAPLHAADVHCATNSSSDFTGPLVPMWGGSLGLADARALSARGCPMLTGALGRGCISMVTCVVRAGPVVGGLCTTGQWILRGQVSVGGRRSVARSLRNCTVIVTSAGVVGAVQRGIVHL